MARQARVNIPGAALHIVQRGTNGRTCFYDDRDRCAYLDALRDTAEQERVAIHAWVLTRNQVHLLVTPQAPGAASRMMRSLGCRYVRGLNARWERSGALWEARFKATLLVDGAEMHAGFRERVRAAIGAAAANGSCRDVAVQGISIGLVQDTNAA